MATNLIVLAFLCLAFPGCNQQPDRYLLRTNDYIRREYIVEIARNELGIREATGKNDGKRVEQYLAVTGLKAGHPWCASFISWIFARAGYQEPRTAWSPALFPVRRRKKEIKPANVLGIWFPDLKRIAHAGLVEKQQGDWIISIEGNTNMAGSREGDGVYRKRRHSKTIYAYGDWISK